MLFVKAFKSLFYAWNGLKSAWKEEHNFRIEIGVALLILFFIFYSAFSFLESALCVIALTLVLGAELVNTAVEDLCDSIQPLQDPVIGKIKDLMAAFVLVTVTGSVLLGILVFYHHFNI